MTAAPPEPAGLLEAFHAYEAALMADDLAALDRLFAPGPATLRGDAHGLLVGHDAISAFRGARGGAPRRRIVETHIQVVDEDHALVVAITELDAGGRGQQTQLWARRPSPGPEAAEGASWKVTAAHVSVPAPALDTRIWRVVGDPLIPSASASGPLAGQTIAVKDLYAVAGHPIGAGNPVWLAQAAPEPSHAETLRQLLDAGAEVRGITRTDEFAYSLAGTNAHYGTPPNPRAPRRISGGSTSGSASAVALGHASIGLGTDTGGSIRVPAAYQGLYGIRTTHAAVPTTGLLPLAPSYDAVGWLTRDAACLRAVGEVLLPGRTEARATGGATGLVVVPELLALADADVAAAIGRWRRDHDLDVREEHWPLAELGDWLAAFQTHQAWQAWQCHGDWLMPRLDVLGGDVRSRFERASRITAGEADTARGTAQAAGARIRELVGDRVLVLPSASSVAPLADADAGELQRVRDATMRLTCLAGLGGLPAVSIPLETDGHLPAGVCLLAAPGRDRDLLDLAVQLADRVTRRHL